MTPRALVKRLLFIFALCAGVTLGQEPGVKNVPIFDLDSLYSRWQTYVCCDSLHGADEICTYLRQSPLTQPYGQRTEREAESESVLGKMYNTSWILCSRIERRDSMALKIGFALLWMVDGAFREDIEASLGRMITVEPETFLYQLKLDRPYVRITVGILVPQGDEYADNIEALRKELIRRIKAMGTVDNPKLNESRDECRAILERTLETL